MITRWPEFERDVRSRGTKLLARLDDFPDAVLVTGCQRSGTTMLAKVIAESDGMHNFKLGAQDPCLDAGLILSEAVDYDPEPGRYCFQTTHVDERFAEYMDHRGDFSLIWCLRNPLSVVYSLVYNWSKWGLNTTYARCGAQSLGDDVRRRLSYRLFGDRAVGKLRKACMIYNQKVSQIFELSERLSCKGTTVVEYDELVKHKDAILPRIYDFIGLNYESAYADKILSSSLSKADRLTPQEADTILTLCGPIYEKAKSEFWTEDIRNILDRAA